MLPLLWPPSYINKIQHMIEAYPQSKRKTQKLEAQGKPRKINCIWNKSVFTIAKYISW